MDIQQIHIAIRQKLQQVNSAVYTDLQNEEIDLAIDNAVMRIIDETIPEIEQDFQKIETLRELHVKSHIINTFQTSEADTLRVPLPYDLKHLISTRSNVYTSNCGSIVKTDLNSNVKVAVVPFKPTEAITTFASFSLVFKVGDVTNLTYTPNTLDTYRYPENLWNFITAFIEGFSANDSTTTPTGQIQCFWETYKNLHYRDSLIFVISNDSTISSITLNFSDSLTKTVNFETYTFMYETATGGEYVKVGNIVAHSTDVSDMLADPFNTTRANRPLTDIHKKYLDIYVTKKFTVDKVFFNYIRLPKPVSLALNFECELSPSVHTKVVDYATLILLESFSSNRYKTMSEEASKH